MSEEEAPKKFSLKRRTAAETVASDEPEQGGTGQPRGWKKQDPEHALTPEEQDAADAVAALAQQKQAVFAKQARFVLAGFVLLLLVALVLQPMLFLITLVLIIPPAAALQAGAMRLRGHGLAPLIAAASVWGVTAVVAGALLFGLLPRWENSAIDYVTHLSTLSKKAVSSLGGEGKEAKAAAPEESSGETAATPTGDDTGDEEASTLSKVQDQAGAAAKAVTDKLASGRNEVAKGTGKLSSGLQRVEEAVIEKAGWLRSKTVIWFFQVMTLLGTFLVMPCTMPERVGKDGAAKAMPGSGMLMWFNVFLAGLAIRGTSVVVKAACLSVITWTGLHLAELPGAFFVAGLVGVLSLLVRPAPLIGMLVAVPMLFFAPEFGAAAGLLVGAWAVGFLAENRLHAWLFDGAMAKSGKVVIERRRGGFGLFGVIRLVFSLALLGLAWVGMTWVPMFQADEAFGERVTAAQDDYQAGRRIEANEQLAELKKERPDDPRPWRSQLAALVTVKDRSGALAHAFELAKQAEGTNTVGEVSAQGFLEDQYRNLMVKLDRLEEPLDASEGFEAVLRMGGGSEDSQVLNQAAEELLKRDENHPQALRQLAENLQFSSNRTRSTECALKLMEQIGEDAGMLEILAKNAMLDKDWAAAQGYAQRWVKLDPTNKVLLQMLETLGRQIPEN